MDASQLSEEQINFICRHALEPMLVDAQRDKRYCKSGDVSIVYANAKIERIGEIFRAVGYWNDGVTE